MASILCSFCQVHCLDFKYFPYKIKEKEGEMEEEEEEEAEDDF